jgi:acyl-CoA reductase-like NAD-dependent aldehyde dehydrogenase
MSESFKLLIDGKLEDGSAQIPVINPATEDLVAQCPVASMDQLNRAVAAAKAAQPGWAALPLDEKRAALSRIADRIEEKLGDLARLLTLEQGKTIGDSEGEIKGLIGTIRFLNTLELKPEIHEDSDRRLVEIHYRPLGVVAGIIPWNFPLILIGNKLSPALLMGNTLVLKPAPTTPLSTLLLGELIADLVPPGVINVIADANDLGDALTSHPDVAKVSFTGSTATGRKVMRSAADGLKRVTLELGGNDPAIVLEDANPKDIAASIFQSTFLNSGQVCVSIKRAYVHEKVYDELCEELSALADAVVVDDGSKQGTQLGPIQNRAQFEKVKSYLDVAKRDGVIAAGGTLPDRPGYFVRPTIVRDIADGSPLVDEEQFGPILPLIRFSDTAEAVRRANALPFGLAASVWSPDIERARAVAEQIDAGTVWINQHLDLAPSIPLPAAKQSGIGIELSFEGLKDFSQMTVLNIRK